MKEWLMVLGLILMVVTAGVALAHEVPGQDENQGIPQRVALVEKVLEVEKLTKQPTIDVKGTDYLPGDTGKLQAYLEIGEKPVETALCKVSVLYPNMTYFIESAVMFPVNINRPDFEGLYYYDFTVPNVTGVYPVNAVCYYDAQIEYDAPYSFYATIPPTKTKGMDVDAGSILDLDVLDTITMDLNGNVDCKDNYCEGQFNFSLPIGWHTVTTSDHRVIITLEQDNDDEVKEFVFRVNGTDYHWFNLTTKNLIQTYQFDINETFDEITDFQIVMKVDDWHVGKVEIDYLQVVRAYNGSYVTDLRGNNELVVSDRLYNLTVTVSDFVESEIDVLPLNQLGQGLLIIIFLILIFTGLFIPASIFGMAYSIIYLDGLFSIVGLLICAVLLYIGKKKKE